MSNKKEHSTRTDESTENGASIEDATTTGSSRADEAPPSTRKSDSALQRLFTQSLSYGARSVCNDMEQDGTDGGDAIDDEPVNGQGRDGAVGGETGAKKRKEAVVETATEVETETESETETEIVVTGKGGGRTDDLPNKDAVKRARRAPAEREADGDRHDENGEKSSSMPEIADVEYEVFYRIDFTTVDPSEATVLLTGALSNLGIPRVVETVQPLDLSVKETTFLELINDRTKTLEQRLGTLVDDASVYLLLGNAALLFGDYHEALEQIEKALEVDDKHGAAWYTRGLILDASGRYPEAIRAFTRATQYDPGLEPAWFHKGVCLDDLGRFKESIRCYDKILDQNVRAVEAYRKKGNALYTLGKYKESQACYDTAERFSAEVSDEEETTLEPVLDQLDSAVLKKRYKHAMETKDALDALVETAKRAGVNTAKFDPDITAAVTAINKCDFDDAQRHMRTARSDIEVEAEERVKEAIIASQETVSELTSYLPVDHAQKLLRSAMTALDAKDYERALHYAQEASEEGEAARERHDHAKKMLQASWSKLVDAKKAGIDVTVAEILLNQARAAMKSHEYEKAIEYAEKAEESARSPRERQAQKVAKRLKALEKEVAELDAEGADLIRVKRYLDEATSQLEGEIYHHAEDYLKKAETALGDARQRLLIKQATVAIADAQALLQEVEEKGGDVVQGTKLLAKAETAFEDEKFIKARNFAQNSIRASERARVDQEREETSAQIMNVESIVRDVKRFGATVEDASALVEKAYCAYDVGDFDTAQERAAEAKKLAVELRKKAFLSQAPIIFSQLERSVANLESVDANLGAIERRFEEAKMAFDGGDYERAVKLTVNVNRAVNKLRKKHFGEKAPDIIISLQSRIAKLKANDVDVQKAEEILQLAMLTLEKEDYEKVIEIIQDAERVTRTIEEQFAIDALGDEIDEYHELLEQIGAMGGDISDSTGLLDKAVQSYNSGEYDAVPKYLEMFKKAVVLYSLRNLIKTLDRRGIEIGDAKNEYLLAKRAYAERKPKHGYMIGRKCFEALRRIYERRVLIDALQKVREKMLQLKRDGVNVAKVRKKFNMIKPALKKNDLDEARSKLEGCERMIETYQQKLETLDANATELIDSTAMIIAGVRNRGGDAKRASNLLEQARFALKEHDFKNAIKFGKEAKGEAKKAQTYRELITTLKTARRKIDELERDGADVAEAEELLNKAKPALQNKNYERAMEYAKKSIATVEEGAHALRMLRTLRNTWDRILEVKDLGLDTEGAERKLNRARAALKRGEPENTGELAREVNGDLAELKAKYESALALIQSTQRTISEVKRTGADVSAAEETFAKMADAIERGAFDRAEALAKKSGEEARGARERFETVLEAVKLAEQELKRAKNMGVQTPAADRQFEAVITALERREHDAARTGAREVWEQVKRSIAQYERLVDMIQLAQNKYSELKRKNVDVAPIEASLRSVMREMDAGNYDRAITQTKRIIEQGLSTELTEVMGSVADTTSPRGSATSARHERLFEFDDDDVLELDLDRAFQAHLDDMSPGSEGSGNEEGAARSHPARRAHPPAAEAKAECETTGKRDEGVVCPHCHERIPGDSIFCCVCGKKVG